MLSNVKILLIIFIIFSYTFSQDTPKLIFVQELFRHGARNPIHTNRVDGSNYSSNQRSLGQLTKKGKSQHYILGQELYKFYWPQLFYETPFEKIYNQSKFYVKSTDVNRTIQSAQSQLLGIFQNLDQLTLTKDDIIFSLPQWPTAQNRSIGPVYTNVPRFQSIPIHVQKGPITPYDNGDFLRHYSPEICFKAKDWQQANMRDPKILSMISHPKITQAIAAFNSELHLKIKFDQFYKYFDNYCCMINELKTVKQIYTRAEYKDTFKAMFTLDLYMKLFYTKQQISTTATGYFNQTVNHFKRVINNQDGVQWAFYSAHDTTIANVLAALNLTNVDCIYQAFLNGITENTDTCIIEYPPYTANIIFEIYKSKPPTFRIKYNGQDRMIPFCDWKKQCPVSVFYTWYDSWKDENFVSTCGIKNNQAEYYLSLSIIALGIIIIFSISSIIRYLHQRKSTVVNETKQLQKQSKSRRIAESLLTEEA